jgi:hypothetical protein
MSDTRSRAAKLAAMAAAVESPHEAATAAGKLVAMGTGGAVILPSVIVARKSRRPAMEIPVEIRCGAETFDGTERRRCTRPASQVRDGLLVS